MSDSKKRMHASEAKPEAVAAAAPKPCARCAELMAQVLDLQKALNTLQR